MLLQEYSFIAYSSAKHNDFHAAESCPTPVLAAVLTHTVTHTGKRADGAHGAKSFRPHPFCGKNARKALYTNGWKAFYHLVRMRSAVRIRPAAPHKPCNHNGYRVLVLSANTGKMRFDYYLTTGAHHSAKKRSALRFFIGYGNHLLCRWRHPVVPTTLNVSRQFLPSKQN